MAKQLIAFDPLVANSQVIIEQLCRNPQYQFLVLTQQSDEIAQLADFLSANPGYDVVHLISHGSAGTIELDSGSISAANVDSYAAQLKRIGKSMTLAGDLMLYGCDIAQGESGQHLIRALASLSGLDVGASTDKTGIGGNWTLESTTGPIGNTLPVAVYPEKLGPSNVINATPGAEQIDGTSSADTIYALEGDDTVFGFDGDDLIYLGDGSDNCGFSSYYDYSYENGDDTIYGGRGNDAILSWLGKDSISGDEGNDRLRAQSSGNTTLFGGDGEDTVEGSGTGSYLLEGNGGNDNIKADGSGNCTLNGGDGGDTIWVVGGGSCFADAGAGNDTLYTEFSNSTLNGGIGDDIIYLPTNNLTYSYTRHFRYFSGGAGNDRMIYPGNMSAYTITKTSTGTTVQIVGDKSKVFDTISQVEILQFDDQSVVISSDQKIHPPTSASATLTTPEDTALVFSTGSFKFTDADPSDSLQAVSITALPTKGTLKLNGTSVTVNQSISVADLTAGKLAFTPALNANGSAYATVGFKVSDGTDFSTSSYNLTINVTPVNDAPLFASPTVAVSTTPNTAFKGTATATDVDVGDKLTYTVKTQGAKGSVTISATTGAYTYTPTKNATGTDSFVISATDQSKASATQTVTVEVVPAVNHAPTVAKAVTTPVSATEGTALSYTLPTGTFKDVDVGDVLTYSATGLPSGIAIDTKTGKLSGTPGYDAADTARIITIKATDKGGLIASMPLTLNVTNKATIIGTSGNDTITAGVGNDSMSGGAGNDTLAGGAGNDTLVGGVGNDVLTGGDGADRFVFDMSLGSSNVDTIKDFVTGTDKIVLSAKVFTKFTGSSAGTAIAAGNLVIGAGVTAKAADSNDYLIYDTGTDMLYYDADGNGAGAAVAFVKVELTGTAAPAFGDVLIGL